MRHKNKINEFVEARTGTCFRFFLPSGLNSLSVGCSQLCKAVEGMCDIVGSL